MITFLAAVYNEEDQIEDLLKSINLYVDAFAVVDDGSIDRTYDILQKWGEVILSFKYKRIPHTGLPETVKNEALSLVEDGSWILMLDADERLPLTLLDRIRYWVNDGRESSNIDYVYFRQIEFLNGQPVREFQKCKLFRKESVTFPLNNIHADDSFSGEGTYKSDWIVLHKKTTSKQVLREQEYLITYKKLLDEGKIDQGRFDWLVNLHHYVRPKERNDTGS